MISETYSNEKLLKENNLEKCRIYARLKLFNRLLTIALSFRRFQIITLQDLLLLNYS